MINCFFLFIQVHKIIGFAPVLLQVVMAEQVDMPVRQAGKVVLLVLVILKLRIYHLCCSTYYLAIMYI